MIARLVLEWHIFLLAVQFLTRLPVPRDLPFSDDLMVRAVKFYPLVGVLVGGIGAAVLLAGSAVLPAPVAVLMSVAATLLATGAFHEDGLADAADGLGGGVTRDAALAIMRDSRLGTYGAVALFVVLGLKVAALAAMPSAVAALALVTGHAVGRWASVEVIATTPYAREAGAKFAAPTVTPDGRRVAAATALAVLAVSVAWLGAAVLAGAVLAGVAAYIFRRRFRAKLGGYTGDCLGGTQQLAEVGLYLGVLAWL